MDINKKIHQTLSDPYHENPLGGMIHLSDFVDMESEISFLDFHLDEALFDNIKCANHWRQPVESEFQADFQSDWQA